MTSSDQYKTPKQKAMAKAHQLSQLGQKSYLCRYTFSGHYFALGENDIVPNVRGFEIVRTYAAA